MLETSTCLRLPFAPAAGRSLLVRYGCLLGLVTAVGCGGAESGPKMTTVSGNVTFDGAPVEKGRIQFRNTESDQRAYGAEITNGKYSLETELGLMTVTITASRIIPGKFDDSNGTPEPVGEMYIPSKYNTDSTLTKTVTAEGPNQFDFALESN